MEQNIGYIYFILQTSVETNEQFYKIGFSLDVEKRLRELKTGNPNRLEIKYIIENTTINFEKHMHLVCDRYRKDGEWFDSDVIPFLLNNSPWFKDNIVRYSKKGKEL